jgi:hypothetical protein
MNIESDILDDSGFSWMVPSRPNLKSQVLRLDLGSFFLFAHDYVIGYNTQPTYSTKIYLKWCQKTVGLVSPCKPYVLTPGTANVPWCGWVGCLNCLLLTPTSITQSWHGAKTTRRMSPPRHSTSLFPPWISSSVHHPNQVLRLDLGSFFLFD